MTDQQRAASIEFVKKLLVANGFKCIKDASCTLSMLKYSKHGFVCIIGPWITIFCEDTWWSKIIILDNQPLKPLRDFIKLSNQK